MSPVSAPPFVPFDVRCRDRLLALRSPAQLMGILNVTPDSLYDGGRFSNLSAALSQARLMVSEGAALIDVGGQSTRPGHTVVPDEEEIRRVVPVIQALLPAIAAPISIDTYKPAVAEAALKAGAHVLNDIHGLQRHPELAVLAASLGAAVVVMHHDPALARASGDPVGAVRAFFERSLQIADDARLPRSQVILDPGIGFGKTQTQNLQLIARLGELADLGCPLLLAASRKSVIEHVLDVPVEERLEGTLATTAVAHAAGVHLVRVHDVKANQRLVGMLDALAAAKASLAKTGR